MERPQNEGASSMQQTLEEQLRKVLSKDRTVAVSVAQARACAFDFFLQERRNHRERSSFFTNMSQSEKWGLAFSAAYQHLRGNKNDDSSLKRWGEKHFYKESALFFLKRALRMASEPLSSHASAVLPKATEAYLQLFSSFSRNIEKDIVIYECMALINPTAQCLMAHHYCKNSEYKKWLSLQTDYLKPSFIKSLKESDGADYETAFYYFERAASQEFELAYIGLGHLYITGLGVQRDFAKAHSCFEKAGAISEAHFCLGVMALRGLGQKSDLAKAAAFFQRSIDLDEKPFLYRGLLDYDRKKAETFLTLAHTNQET